MRKCLSIRVHGKVQGVFFRASTKEKADALQLVGFVRNESDGSVYIEVSGSGDQLNAFTDWCRHGPPHAKVHDVHIQEIPLKPYHAFTIER